MYRVFFNCMHTQSEPYLHTFLPPQSSPKIARAGGGNAAGKWREQSLNAAGWRRVASANSRVLYDVGADNAVRTFYDVGGRAGWARERSDSRGATTTEEERDSAEAGRGKGPLRKQIELRSAFGPLEAVFSRRVYSVD